MDECLSCSTGNTCDSCYDLTFLDPIDKRCKTCSPPCFLCENSESDCIVCDLVGWNPPTCKECDENWFMYEE